MYLIGRRRNRREGICLGYKLAMIWMQITMNITDELGQDEKLVGVGEHHQ